MTTRVEYLVGDDIDGIIKNTLYNFYNRQVDFAGPTPDRDVFVETGIGCMMQMNEAIKKMITNSGLVVNASELGFGNKIEGIDDKQSWTSYVIPFLANVKFAVNPEFDPIHANETINPWINGFRQSSYNYRLTYSIGEIKEEIAEIVAVGRKPAFRQELIDAINKCALDKEYDMSAQRLMEYIMNCLKNLK